MVNREARPTPKLTFKNIPPVKKMCQTHNAYVTFPSLSYRLGPGFCKWGAKPGSFHSKSSVGGVSTPTQCLMVIQRPCKTDLRRQLLGSSICVHVRARGMVCGVTCTPTPIV